ncbi:hypothetical protein MVEN_02114100 [Mycena venus]|uniref:Uncharacterized protein n=1 Tax=Mycena venus TaxID=2733690 RepID=A0A8H6X9Z8_9AGAR|nr:hypothetical protein MVEN_02114100 [Mycena venus]
MVFSCTGLYYPYSIPSGQNDIYTPKMSSSTEEDTRDSFRQTNVPKYDYGSEPPSPLPADHQRSLNNGPISVADEPPSSEEAFSPAGSFYQPYTISPSEDVDPTKTRQIISSLMEYPESCPTNASACGVREYKYEVSPSPSPSLTEHEWDLNNGPYPYLDLQRTTAQGVFAWPGPLLSPSTAYGQPQPYPYVYSANRCLDVTFDSGAVVEVDASVNRQRHAAYSITGEFMGYYPVHDY